jgi:3-mercaptopyruvate sulfurtransferase SseA
MTCRHLPTENRSPAAEFLVSRIRQAQFFDIDQHSDQSSRLPHMLPSDAVFSRAVTSLGIGNDSAVVVYDSECDTVTAAASCPSLSLKVRWAVACSSGAVLRATALVDVRGVR